MNNSAKSKVDINKKEPYKQPPYDDNAVQVTVTPAERKSLVDIAVIMSKLMVKETNTPLLPDSTYLVFGRWL